MDLWIVPGAPLMPGRGWRIWCSKKGEGSFSPPQFEVRHHHATVPSQSEWTLLSQVPGLLRRMGMMTLMLKTPDPPEGAIYQVVLSTSFQSTV